MRFSWRLSGLAIGLVLVFLFVAPVQAGPLGADTSSSPDAEKRQTDSFGCIIGAAGMGIATLAAVAVTAAPVDAAVAAAAGGAGAGAALLPLMTAGWPPAARWDPRRRLRQSGSWTKARMLWIAWRPRCRDWAGSAHPADALNGRSYAAALAASLGAIEMHLAFQE